MNRMAELTQHGYRRTSQRAVILDILEGAGGHMTAEQIAKRVESGNPAMNRSTVYRTLEMLAEIGMVKATRMGRALYYEISREGEMHHHIRCVSCQGTVHLDAGQVDRLLARLAVDQGVDVIDIQVVVRGICRTCRRRGKTSN
jgi:Fur family ferric uptake transcriptional regulator